MNIIKPLPKLLYISSLLTTILFAEPFAMKEDANLTKSEEWIFLPYAFSSDSTGFAGGISAMKEGLFQPQTA
ncbi:MAG: hypothetical protein GQ531_04370, partial [Sulfurovum sp.]|nr:hypothetical protein [Sulfurovum sp.]